METKKTDTQYLHLERPCHKCWNTVLVGLWPVLVATENKINMLSHLSFRLTFNNIRVPIVHFRVKGIKHDKR